MADDPRDIAKLRAEMASLRGQIAVVGRQGMPGQMLHVHIDHLTNLLAYTDACERRATAAEAARDELKDELAAARGIVRETLWMARRYADGRMSYATDMYNRAARQALAAGIVMDDHREPLFAHDGMGAGYAGLTEDEQEAAARHAGSLAAARETIARLCDAFIPLAELWKELCVDPDVYPDDELTERLHPIMRRAARALADVKEAGAK